MASRLRELPPTLFEVFLEVSAPEKDKRAVVLRKYPDDFNDEKREKAIVEFAFPCEMSSDAVQLFCFVLTDQESKYTFGYCRHTPKTNTCLTLLSALPWFELFYKLLNHIASVMHNPNNNAQDIEALLTYAYHQTIPNPGEIFVVESSLGKNKMECVCPDYTKLPRMPDNKNLMEYYNAVDEPSMIAVFVSMICERRIIFTSKKLSQLSSCVIAASNLIYPMHWQHIFVPVLPAHLTTYLHAPMPFLVGVPTSTFEAKMHEIDFNEVVWLDIDKKTFQSPFNDVQQLPTPVLNALRKNLASSNHLLGDSVSRSFLRSLVVLIGGYREGLQWPPGKEITFSLENFVKSRPPAFQSFLEQMMGFQIFQQFVQERLLLLQQGSSLQDEFEEECRNTDVDYSYQFNDWFSKKLGATANRDNLFKSVNQVRNRSKEAFKDFKSRLTELKDDAPTFKPPPLPNASINLSKQKALAISSPHVKKLFPKSKSSKGYKSREWHGMSESFDAEDIKFEGRDAVTGEVKLRSSEAEINLTEEFNALINRPISELQNLETNSDYDRHLSVENSQAALNLARHSRSLELLTLDDDRSNQGADSLSRRNATQDMLDWALSSNGNDAAMPRNAQNDLLIDAQRSQPGAANAGPPYSYATPLSQLQLLQAYQPTNAAPVAANRSASPYGFPIAVENNGGFQRGFTATATQGVVLRQNGFPASHSMSDFRKSDSNTGSNRSSMTTQLPWPINQNGAAMPSFGFGNTQTAWRSSNSSSSIGAAPVLVSPRHLNPTVQSKQVASNNSSLIDLGQRSATPTKQQLEEIVFDPLLERSAPSSRPIAPRINAPVGASAVKSVAGLTRGSSPLPRPPSGAHLQQASLVDFGDSWFAPPAGHDPGGANFRPNSGATRNLSSPLPPPLPASKPPQMTQPSALTNGWERFE